MNAAVHPMVQYSLIQENIQSQMFPEDWLNGMD